MKISIAMATYNGEKYLQEQLDSFVSQTRRPDELIITDDCSTDQTEAIARKFAEIAPFKVEFHRNEESLGVSGNFNAALMKTTGDLVFLSDQDDVWFPNKIKIIESIVNAQPRALVFINDALLTDSELNCMGISKLTQIFSAGLSEDYFVMGCCCAVQRRMIELFCPIPSAFRGHDVWLAGIATSIQSKHVIDEPLQYYRRHGKNESQGVTSRIKKVRKYHVLLQKFRSYRKSLKNETGSSLPSSIELEVQALENALVTCHYELAPKIQRAITEKKKVAKHYENRYTIRQKGFSARMISVFKLFSLGEYVHSDGFKSAIRDLSGR